MSFFPALLDMKKLDILIVGGGEIATEKIEKLLYFTTKIKVVASKLSLSMKRYIEENDLFFEERAFRDDDLTSIDIVIVAVDDIELQREIFNKTRESKILCNSVDSIDYCDFIFPSFIKEDDLVIAISTSGASPAVAKHLRQYIQKLLPKNISHFLKELKDLRSTLPKGRERMKLLDKKAKEFFEKL